MGNMEPDNTPAVEETDSWTGPSQEEWTQTMEFVNSIQQAMEAPAQAEPQQEDGQQKLELNPFEDDFQSRLDAYLDSKLAPVNELSKNAAYAEADERAVDIITDLQAQHGEFMLPDSADLVKVLANEYVEEAQERYGFGPRAAEAALGQAYKDVKAREEAIGKAYHERQMNQLSTLGKASREPAVDATAAQQVNSVKGNEMDLVRSYFTPNTGAN
jgi:hypothetical protein